MTKPNDEAVGHDAFSFGKPSTFRFATAEQKAFLHSIADAEFSLQHLPEEDQHLLEEALSKSGIEVYNSCAIERTTTGDFGAFFKNHNHVEHVHFRPVLGMKYLSTNGEAHSDGSEWSTINGDYTEYPYPFSEAPVIPKAIPVDLSSIWSTNRTATVASFTAKPSLLLTAKLGPKDRIVSKEDLIVDFEVDLQTRRIARQTMYLEKSKRVYFGIRIKQLEITYEFGHDPTVDRNVMKTLHQKMVGRLWLLYRPNLTVDSSLTYSDCVGDVRDLSYLYESMESIGDLEQSSIN